MIKRGFIVPEQVEEYSKYTCEKIMVKVAVEKELVDKKIGEAQAKELILKEVKLFLSEEDIKKYEISFVKLRELLFYERDLRVLIGDRGEMVVQEYFLYEGVALVKIFNS